MAKGAEGCGKVVGGGLSQRIVIERNLRTTMRRSSNKRPGAATAWLGKRVQQRVRKRSKGVKEEWKEEPKERGGADEEGRTELNNDNGDDVLHW